MKRKLNYTPCRCNAYSFPHHPVSCEAKREEEERELAGDENWQDEERRWADRQNARDANAERYRPYY